MVSDPYQLSQPTSPPPGGPYPNGAGGSGPGRGKGWLVAVGSGAAVLLAVIAGVVGWSAGWFGGASSQAATSTSSPPPPGTPTPTSTPQVTVTATKTPALTPEQERDAAYNTLEQLVADDALKNPVRGQWVAQLASKTENIVDSTQKATPFTLQDILAEVRQHQANPSYGSTVRVLHQGDWGTTQPGPSTMWVTVADLDLRSQADVQAWCERTFTLRGEPLLNICYPRELTLKGQ